MDWNAYVTVQLVQFLNCNLDISGKDGALDLHTILDVAVITHGWI